ncbi:nitrile hydratase subunit beta [Halolamina sp.]|jgi:nitrile hydratase|uniref:nitrile hydratase subunit beta n=1 Tax=Halolamina sp. TaxID=1940283 RepID=UPI000223B809|nr:Nitrile hydratase [halophilic archaeon DL31]
MNGIHDLGGMDGFDDLPADEPDAASPFHHEWEGVVEAMFLTGLARGAFSLDRFRATLERHTPEYYLETPYYERWQTGIESLFADAGVVDEADLRERALAFERGDADLPEQRNPAVTEEVLRGVTASYGSNREPAEPTFEEGDRVVVNNDHPSHHTRAPRYTRGVEGEIQDHSGTHVFPDDNAQGEERAVPVYNVRFEAADLWGEAHTDADGIRLECWEPYLRAAD